MTNRFLVGLVLSARPGAYRRTILILLLYWLTPSPSLTRTLEVGPAREIVNAPQAAALAQDGDSIVFDPGVYRDCAIWPASHLTVEARQAPRAMNRTIMTQTIVTGGACGDRALFYFLGHDITVRGINFQHARDSSHTGAGILMEGDNLTVENATFVDNENGILAGGSPNSVVRVRNVWFQGNGSCAGPCAHALYVGARIARLEVSGCTFLDTHVGHSIKSRAVSTLVRNSRIDDRATGTSSYQIELPDGGDTEIINNEIHKGVLSDNKEVAISIGTETVRNPSHVLDIKGNRFTSDLVESVQFVRNLTATRARLVRNTLIGRVIPLEGPGTVE
jgi:hypothetical protein